jgi:hypothetical protein
LPDFPEKEIKTMRTFFCIIAVAMTIYFIPSAKADTDFTLNLTAQNGKPASGTVALVETATAVQIDGFTLSLEDGSTFIQANTLLAGCSTCMWRFETGILPTDSAILYLYNGSTYAQFGCFECSTADSDQFGTIPVQPTSTAVPEASSLAMMGMTGIGLLGALKRKFLTRSS